MLSTIFITFKEGVSEKLAQEIFKDYQIKGFQTSHVLRRYAVEVPVGQESKFINLLSCDPFIVKVSSAFIKGQNRKFFKR